MAGRVGEQKAIRSASRFDIPHRGTAFPGIAIIIEDRQTDLTACLRLQPPVKTGGQLVAVYRPIKYRARIPDLVSERPQELFPPPSMTIAVPVRTV